MTGRQSLIPSSYSFVRVIYIAILFLPHLLFSASTSCPSECDCSKVVRTIWCAGGHYDRIPKLPDGFTRLVWTNPSISSFSLRDISTSLESVTLRKLKIQDLDYEIPKSPSQIKTFHVDGCCTNRFPRLSNFPKLESFKFNVKCQPNTELHISEHLVNGLAKESLNRYQFDISGSCVSSIATRSFRGILKFKTINLSKNKLERLSVADKTAPTHVYRVKRFDVSSNPSLKYLDLGSSRPSRLDISGTAIPVKSILVNNQTLYNLKLGSGKLPLNVGEICDKFLKLINLDLSGQILVNATETNKCKRVQNFNIDNAEQKFIPNMTNTAVYKFDGAWNSYRTLDFSLFSPDTTHIDLSNNQIDQVIVTDCRVLQKMHHLRLTNNKLSSVNPKLIECLPKDKYTTLEINISENPMTGIFEQKITTVPRKYASSFNFSSIGEIQKSGRFPEWLFNNFAGIKIVILESNNLQSLQDLLRQMKSAEIHSNIKQLLLSGNRFKFVSDRLLVGFAKLEVLDLSKNELSSIHRHAFEGLESLETLNLRENNLQTIGPWLAPFAFSRYLKLLDLSTNQFDCSCSTMKLLNESNSTFDGSHQYLMIPNTKGLQCDGPQKVKYLPVTKAFFEKKEVICTELKEESHDKTNVLDARGDLIIILGVLVSVLFISLIVVVAYVASWRRKRFQSYKLTHTNEATSV